MAIQVNNYAEGWGKLAKASCIPNSQNSMTRQNILQNPNNHPARGVNQVCGVAGAPHLQVVGDLQKGGELQS